MTDLSNEPYVAQFEEEYDGIFGIEVEGSSNNC